MDVIHQKLKYLMVEKHVKWIFSKLTVANQSTYLKSLIIIWKRKRFALIYSPYKELLDYGITFEKKIKQTDIAGYSLKTRKQTRNIIF